MEKEERQELTTGEYVYYDFNGQRWYGVENEGTGKWFPEIR